MSDIEDTTTPDQLRKFVEQVRTLREYQKIRDQSRLEVDIVLCKRLESELDQSLLQFPKGS